MREKPAFSLMDAVHAQTFKDKAMGVRLSSAVQAVQRTYRAKLREAQRFHLDDESVRLVCHLSHEQDRLPGWSLLARLPYEIMWVEFNQHVKVQEFEEMNKLHRPFDPDLVAKQVGFLFFRDSEDSSTPRWVCHGFFWDPTQGGIMSHMLAYVFDPEGDTKFPLRGSRLWKAPTLSLRPGFPRMPLDIQTTNGATIKSQCDPELILAGLFGPGKGTIKGVQVTKEGEGEYRVTDDDEGVVSGPEWLIPRMAVIVDPWWEGHLAKKFKTEPEKTNKLVMIEVKEDAGYLRWLITMLAAINGLPRDVKHHEPRQGRHSVGMYQLDYFRSSTIRLDIPRENRLIHSTKALDRVAEVAHRHRPLHWVVGHWRIVERAHRPPGVFCRHVPALVESGLAVCERCGLLVRYIESHQRGDEKYGVVDHRYEVTAKEKRSHS